MSRYRNFLRDFYPGIGEAVAKRTVIRQKEDGTNETWGDVAYRVSLGNSLLDPFNPGKEFERMFHHMKKASILMSGRHLQHGDKTQPKRRQEPFTNCSTSMTSFIQFMLLLNGSGVGRLYDSDLMLVDWKNAPNVITCMSARHPDFKENANKPFVEASEDVRDLFKHNEKVVWFMVPDTREGWAAALGKIEVMAFQKKKDWTLVLDMSNVREKGAPIRGMQDRPASGPVPLMHSIYMAFKEIENVDEPWKQTMIIDHWMADCVRVGGARRSARIALMSWDDPGALDFAEFKRPLEYLGMEPEEVIKYRNSVQYPPMTRYYSSNNSILANKEFYERLAAYKNGRREERDIWAYKVWKKVIQCSYADGTGEPGIVDGTKLVEKGDRAQISFKEIVNNIKKIPEVVFDHDEEEYLLAFEEPFRNKRNVMIVNPCGEENLIIYGGFCVIGDVAPYFADTLDEAEDAFRTTARALIRTNTMNSIYDYEVKRTNRIGVGITGVHEFAWKFFKVGFKTLINPDFEAYRECNNPIESENPRVRAAAFWFTLSRFNRAVKEEAEAYSKKLGMEVPHTMMTVKPSGSVSKLHGLTEGWHLPAMAYYLRWVQFQSDSPIVDEHERNGYPVIRHLNTYSGVSIVGFPTELEIAKLGLGDELVTAHEASIEDQFKWIELGERFYLKGVDPETMETYDDNIDAQISYTAKYSPEKISMEEYERFMYEWMPRIKCCSVLPIEDVSSYEYLPEEKLTREQYDAIVANIRTEDEVEEEIDFVHIACEGGSCPIDFREKV